MSSDNTTTDTAINITDTPITAATGMNSNYNNHCNDNLSSVITCGRCKGAKSGLENAPIIPCGNKECDKAHNFVCFQGKYKKQDWYDEIPVSDLSVF